MADAFPHQLLERYVADHIGRRADLFGDFADDLFVPLVQGISDQLSIYVDVRPYARLSIAAVTLQEGAERCYVLIGIQDRGNPLRLVGTMEHWDMPLQTNTPTELGELINGRRWRFIDHWLGRFVEPLLCGVADIMVEFYQRKPHATPKAGMIRFLEGVDMTHLCVEIDDRSVPTTNDVASRYRVQ